MELTMDKLKEMIVGAVKEKSDTLRNEILAEAKRMTDEVQHKALFPEGVDGEVKTADGSIMNMSVIKSLAHKLNVPGTSEADWGKAFMAEGGPFVKLSPVMEMFGRMLACGCKGNLLAGRGFNFEQYSKSCDAQYKAFDTKAASGQSEGTNADGGFTVPIEFAATVVEFAFQLSDILKQVWRVPMNTSIVKYPKLSQQDGNYFGGVLATWTTEAATLTPQKVAFEQNVFTAHKLYLYTAFTSELVEDSLINIVNYVAGVVTRAYWYEVERCVIRGSGSGQPLGIIEDPIVKALAVARKTAGSVDVNDLYSLEGAMDENFRNLSYITRRKAIATMRKARDTVGQPLVHEGWDMFGGSPTMIKNLNGYPYYVTRNCHDVGSIGDIICGDLGMYMLAIRRDMKIDMSDAPLWTSDQIALRLTARLDGKPGSSYAFKVLKGTGS